MQRVAIFVDGGGFRYVRKEVSEKLGKNLDFEKFCQKVCGERQFIRAYYCDAVPSQQKEPNAYRESIKHLDSLEQTPYVETSRSVLMYPPGESKPRQAGVDMRVAMYMVKLAYNNAYDVAVLVCGDSDFKDVIKTVKDMGKHVEYLCYPKVMMATALIAASDKVIKISLNWLEECLVEI